MADGCGRDNVRLMTAGCRRDNVRPMAAGCRLDNVRLMVAGCRRCGSNLHYIRILHCVQDDSALFVVILSGAANAAQSKDLLYVIFSDTPKSNA